MSTTNRDSHNTFLRFPRRLAGWFTNRMARTANRFRQFGWRVTLWQMLTGMFRRIFRSQRLYVFTVQGTMGRQLDDPCIKPLTMDIARTLSDFPDIPRSRSGHTCESLRTGCLGVCIEIDGVLAGYAMVQLQGRYQIGTGLLMDIPAELAVLLDLFVRPRYRGRGLALRLSTALLTLVPADRIAVGFVRIHNRYSLRSWMALGAVSLLRIDRTCFLNRKWKNRFTVLHDTDVASSIRESLHTIPPEPHP